MYSRNGQDSRPKFGEIWMCYLTSNDRNVQKGYRPVFIASNNKNNEYAPTLNIIPLTSKMNKRQLPIHVELWDFEKYGLEEPSTMLVEQITTIQAINLDKRVGNIKDADVLRNIWDAMMYNFPSIR